MWHIIGHADRAYACCVEFNVKYVLVAGDAACVHRTERCTFTGHAVPGDPGADVNT